MSLTLRYQRAIRDATQTVWYEKASRIVNLMSQNTMENYHLRLGSSLIGQYHVTYRPDGTQQVTRNSMPCWWAPPSLAFFEKLSQRYAVSGSIPAVCNVVTFAMFLRNGSMVLQPRSFSSATGAPIGSPGTTAIPCGGMETTDHGLVLPELVRECKEELGVDVSGHVRYLGTVYNPDHGLTDHVYRVTRPYEDLLTEQCRSVEEALEIVFNPEGLGHLYLNRKEVKEEIQHGRLAPISQRIMQAFPELMPA